MKKSYRSPKTETVLREPWEVVCASGLEELEEWEGEEIVIP